MLTAIGEQFGMDAEDLRAAGKDVASTSAQTRTRRPKKGSSNKAIRADARRNRAQLLEAASELVAQRGLRASVADIADRAGVTVATLFRHFPTKRDLLAAISEERVKAVEDLVQDALAREDIREAVTQVFEDIMEMQARDRGLVPLIEGAISADLHAELVRRWRELMRRAQDAGVVRDDISDTDIPFLLASSGGVARLLGDARPSLRRRYARLLFDSFRPDSATSLESKPPSIREVVDAFSSATPEPSGSQRG
jgi:AcrR family transcriptional regulator